MMRRSIALPFLVLGDNSVTAGNWEIVQIGESSTAGDTIEKWDYQSQLSVQREFLVDQACACTELDLTEDDLQLELIVQTGTGYGHVPRGITTLCRRPIQYGDSFTISADVNSGQLAGNLFLMTHILLADQPVRPGTLSPTEPASRLWSDSLCIALESDALRFPTELVSFNAQFAGRSQQYAPWFLYWTSDEPERDLASALRLYLNSDCEDFINRVQVLDSETLRSIMADIMIQVVSRSLANVLLVEDDEDRLPAGSLGWQAMEWLRLAFASESIRTVRSILESRPGEFHAAFYAAAEFRDEGT